MSLIFLETFIPKTSTQGLFAPDLVATRLQGKYQCLVTSLYPQKTIIIAHLE